MSVTRLHREYLVGERRAHVDVEQHTPPATCCATSISILDRSPSRSCRWNLARPVGLIRSPMIANGWSWPMVTALVAEETMVTSPLLSRPMRSVGSGRRRTRQPGWPPSRFNQAVARAQARRRISSLALTTAADASAAT